MCHDPTIPTAPCTVAARRGPVTKTARRGLVAKTTQGDRFGRPAMAIVRLVGCRHGDTAVFIVVSVLPWQNPT